MRRKSTLWFVLAAAWFVLLIVNLLRHHYDRNTLVIGIAVAAFLLTGAGSRLHEQRMLRRQKFR
jgi:uncharacterized SAM-binding protein YcdF (DUF218 family)